MLASCDSWNGDAFSGKTIVDGIHLKYENAVNLSQTYSGDSLEIEGGTLTVDVKGNPEPKVNLQINYMEYAQGDATLSITDGKIAANTKSGKPIAITSIVGTIPNHLSLNISSGTGSISIADIANSGSASINTGTGEVDVTQCQLNVLVINTGTGAVTLQNSKIAKADVSTGTGDIILKNSQVEKRNFSMGTGDLIEE